MIDHESILESVREIKTATSDEDKRVLMDAIESAPAGVVLEIGIYYGTNLIVAAKTLQALKRKGMVWGIDPLTLDVDADGKHVPGGGYFQADPLLDIFESLKKAGVSESVAIFRQDSKIIAPGWPFLPCSDIAVLVVDGCHARDYVLHDLTEFSKWVVPGGVILAHDYDPDGTQNWSAATEGINEFIRRTGWKPEHRSNYAVFRRPE